jgi:CRP-like cAMP-binding protein
MVTAQMLKEVAFFRGLRTPVLETLAETASIVKSEDNAIIAKQHDRAIALFVLLSGNVQFLIDVEGSGKLLVSVSRDPGLIIGWSIFRPPYRYTTTVRCEGVCRLLRIPHHVIDELVKNDPASGLILLRRVNLSLATRLESERARLLEMAAPRPHEQHKLPDPILPTDTPWSVKNLQTPQVMADFLDHSSLFEGLESRLLDWLAHQALVKALAPKDTLFKQQGIADYLYLLIDGRIGISYCDESDERCVFLRALENVGDQLGWSALVDPRRYRTSAFAIELTHVVALPSNALEKLCEQEPSIGVEIMRRILRTIGSRLSFTRVRMVAQRYGTKIQTMRTIIDQAAETLPVTSPLHKIPYLLENRLTLSDAFHALELTRAHGEPVERNLAELSLEVLQDVRKELEFYQGLQHAYEAVANAPLNLSAEEVRKRSMIAFLELFDRLSWRTAGEELLPRDAGNIVIMNHLENHMDTMLPNEFRLTLDSHFVSSVILFRRYGEAPIRVVRKPEMGWFGYQQYFDRLDYLYVYPGDVDEEDQDQALTRESRNRRFIERATSHLKSGRNLLIAPEGRCSPTEASPCRFRLGAFRLAAAVQPEPLIVPIAVANFDKRLTETTTAAIVFPPFRLSDRVDDPRDKTALLDFVGQLQQEYRNYVQQASALARD